MSNKLLIVACMMLSLGRTANAHRLDEYLQATLVSIEGDHIEAQMRLVPGVAVSSEVLASIDADSDAVISDTEGRAYAEHVLRDLSLTVDGASLTPQLTSMTFPPTGDMQEGRGEIQIEFSASLPRGGTNRRLVFENHHQSEIAAYLVNCSVPRDPAIRIVAQHRNPQQSLYQLDYTQATRGHGARSADSGS